MIRVGLCGVGTVGSGVVNLINDNAEVIAQRLGKPLQLTLVGARRDPTNCDLSSLRVTRDVLQVASDPDVDLLVELIGGSTTAFELIKTALNNHKHVVTANKALIAEHGEELMRLAAQNNCILRFEAAVAGGIPIIDTLCGALAGNRIQEVVGIINGTSNFILSSMHKEGLGFAEALTLAQRMGYAEADPGFDIEGIDAAHKLAIIASLAFGTQLDYFNLAVEGISAIDPLDFRYARKLGYEIKHLGIARLLEQDDKQLVQMRVHPTLVPKNTILAQVDGATNALLVDSQPLGRGFYIGQGAGAGPTASAVLSDIIAAARAGESAHAYPSAGFQQGMRNHIETQPFDEVVCSNYLRLHAIDEPGVLARITGIFAEEKNSIEAILQQEPDHSDKHPVVPIVMLTKSIAEYRMRRVITCLEQLEEIRGKVHRIRVEHLEEPCQPRS